MKILIDGHMLGSREGGNERYIKNLAFNLIKNKKNKVLILTTKKFKLNNEDKKKYLINKDMIIKDNSSNFKRIYYSLPKIAKRYNIDIIHTTTLCPLLSFTKSVITIHDVSFMEYPQFYSLRENLMFKFLLPPSIKKTSVIIVPSNFTKKEVIKYFPYSKNKIFVTPEASEPTFKVLPKQISSEYLRKKYNIVNPFVLVLNSTNPKKNINVIIDGFINAKKELTNYELIIIGSSRNIKNDYKKLVFIKIINHITDHELAIFYNCAQSFIYFSVYEGFGLPLIEAASCKCPIIASDTEINRETTNNSAILVNPSDSKKLSQKIILLAKNNKIKEKIINNAYKNAVEYSWKKTALLTEKAYLAAK